MTVLRDARLWGFVLVLVAWEVLARLDVFGWLPLLSNVLAEMVGLVQDGSLKMLGSTFTLLGVGLLISSLIAALVSVVLARSRTLEVAFEPLINAGLAAPTLALVPIYIMIWGFGQTTRIVTIVSFTVLPMIVTWVDGLRNRPENLLEMSHSYMATPLQQLRLVVLPNAAPMILTGLRVGVVLGIKGVVSAEVIIGVVGIGRLLTDSAYKLDRLYAIVGVLVLLSVVSYLVIHAVENRFASRVDPVGR